MDEPEFTIGIEEEYLLVDVETGDLAQAPDALMDACTTDLQGKVSPEFLRCQIEVGSGVCKNISEARDDLRNLRATVARHAADHGLAPIAAACHPFADWKDQHHTDRERYNALKKDLGGVGRRMLICGMHVHVCLEEPDLRIDVMNQLTYFLPHLLALSTSSPYWQGDDTGLNSYRLTVFDNLPRTGLPPKLDSWATYERSVQILIDTGVIEDASKIWWDLRPSSRFPTIENRICDVSPRLETTLTLAALTQCITRMLWRLARKNQRWRIYDTFLIAENRWRAQRYGVSEGMIDYGQRSLVPFADLIDELLDLIAEDAQALDSVAEVENARRIVKTGTSADTQRQAYARARSHGADHRAALRSVVQHLVDEFQTDL